MLDLLTRRDLEPRSFLPSQDHFQLRTAISGPGYHNRQAVVLQKIHSLFRSLDSSACGGVTPKVEYWIDLAPTGHSTTFRELTEEVAYLAWGHNRGASAVRLHSHENIQTPHLLKPTRLQAPPHRDCSMPGRRVPATLSLSRNHVQRIWRPSPPARPC